MPRVLTFDALEIVNGGDGEEVEEYVPEPEPTKIENQVPEEIPVEGAMYAAPADSTAGPTAEALGPGMIGGAAVETADGRETIASDLWQDPTHGAGDGLTTEEQPGVVTADGHGLHGLGAGQTGNELITAGGAQHVDPTAGITAAGHELPAALQAPEKGAYEHLQELQQRDPAAAQALHLAQIDANRRAFAGFDEGAPAAQRTVQVNPTFDRDGNLTRSEAIMGDGSTMIREWTAPAEPGQATSGTTGEPHTIDWKHADGTWENSTFDQASNTNLTRHGTWEAGPNGETVTHTDQATLQAHGDPNHVLARVEGPNGEHFTGVASLDQDGAQAHRLDTADGQHAVDGHHDTERAHLQLASDMKVDAEGLIKNVDPAEAAKALQSHASRDKGFGEFKDLKTQAERAEHGMKQIENILRDPRTAQTASPEGKWSGGTDFRNPDGRGVRFDSSGKFVGFLDETGPVATRGGTPVEGARPSAIEEVRPSGGVRGGTALGALGAAPDIAKIIIDPDAVRNQWNRMYEDMQRRHAGPDET